jgi:hypothetical protein
LLEPPRAARPAFAVVVLADHRAALPVEDHHRRGAAPALPTRLAKRVGREGDSVDGCARHWRVISTQSASPCQSADGVRNDPSRRHGSSYAPAQAGATSGAT